MNEAFIKGTKILESLEIPYFLTGGTFLGIKRDGHLIEWDEDIDVDVLAEDMTPDKIKALSEMTNKFHAGNADTLQPGHLAFFPNEIRFDIFCLHRKNGKRFRNYSHNNCMWFDEKFYNEPFEYLEYNNKKYKVPSPQVEWLEFFYGKDWNKPDKTWNWGKANNICNIKDI